MFGVFGCKQIEIQNLLMVLFDQMDYVLHIEIMFIRPEIKLRAYSIQLDLINN
jgi:hypothetical protein